jgi:hypothetical protein
VTAVWGHGRDWKRLKFMPDKAKIATEGAQKVILVRAEDEEGYHTQNVDKLRTLKSPR